jgi:uncharacterized protein (DUF983 family)
MGTIRDVRRLAGRGLRLRCPNCGGRPVFTSWFSMLPNCPVCGFRFERGERGYWVGAYFINLVLMELAFVLWFVGFLLATWPDPDWLVFFLSTFVLMLAMPVVGFPFSRTLFLAFDLWFRPPEAGDFELPSEPAAPHRS